MGLSQPNFPTGNSGLIVVDKVGNKILFLDPTTFETVHILSGFAARVHELAISPDHAWAFVPFYGDGRHGANPNPGHLIAVIDLRAHRHANTFSVAPLLAPHGLRWGSEGHLYCVCKDSGFCLRGLTHQTGSIAIPDIGKTVAIVDWAHQLNRLNTSTGTASAV